MANANWIPEPLLAGEILELEKLSEHLMSTPNESGKNPKPYEYLLRADSVISSQIFNNFERNILIAIDFPYKLVILNRVT
jgi:hypothetical protein